MKKFAAVIACVILCALSAGGAPDKYPPAFVPMWPGLREFARADRMRSLKPYLKDAQGDWLFAADLGSEIGGGASNYATNLGNGRLSVELSPWADLTVYRWPSPLYTDQLRYFTATGTADRPVRMFGPDAPSADWRRYGHPVEPCPGLGSRGGLRLGAETVWLGDPSWTSSRAFVPENSTTLVTRLARIDATVDVTDFIDPDHDLLVRSFVVSGVATRFFYHSTFAPQVPDPMPPTQDDPRTAGYAAVWLPDERAVMHFQPRSKNDAAPSLAGLKTAADLDRAFPGGGAFVAWGFLDPGTAGPKPGSSPVFQVGADTCPRQHSKPAAAASPAGGRCDAADGELSGNAAFAGLVDATLSADLPAGGGTVTVLIATAGTAEEAAAVLRQARTEGLAALRERATTKWTATAGRIRVPAATDAVTARVIRRSVLNLLQAQDRDTGAIVASVSRQPDYNYDWPRDGSFFDLTLDLAGFPTEVSRHAAFYVRTQLPDAIGFNPRWMLNFRSPFFRRGGHWSPNLTAGGDTGFSNLWPFELDETGLCAWDLWRHERALPEGERAAYIAATRETLGRAADALLDWIDVRQGWTRPAYEDDNFPPDATLHGVSSVLTGIAAACEAGPRWGFAEARYGRWCEAAASLRAGARGRMKFPRTIEEAGWRGLAWTLWPAPVFDDYNEPGARAIMERLAASIRRKSGADAPGFAYLGEEIFTLALADREGRYRQLLEDALRVLTHDVPFPGTDCYGEVTVWGEFAGPGTRVAQQRTSIPHLWNGATVYLAALAVYAPEAFDGMRPPAPGSR